VKRLFFFLALAAAAIAQESPSDLPVGQERIKDFASRIEIDSSGGMLVTETISVHAEGVEIKRGIYRDFPTIYRGPWGLKKHVQFDVVSVERDGKPEPWHSETRENGLRLYFGEKDVILPPGDYTYRLQYQTRQLGFFKDFDELYWNVTGNGWAFPIEHASACVKLPKGASVRSVDAYTGPAGEKGTNSKEGKKPPCDVYVETTATLSPREGFTIAVTWPKGFVNPTSTPSNLFSLLLANLGLLFAAGGLVVGFIYFLAQWAAVGRDPDKGVIIPLYHPPKGFTPQDARYLMGLGKMDNTNFAAAVLHLAVQGSLKITQAANKEYTLKRENKAPGFPEESLILNALFPGTNKIELTQANHTRMRASISAADKAVRKKVDTYFKRNTVVWVIGGLITILPLAISLIGIRGDVFGVTIWVAVWSVGCVLLTTAVVSAWRGAKKLNAIPITLFSIPFLAGWFLGFGKLMELTSPWVGIVFFLGVTMTAVFHHLLKAPSVEGRKIMDEIEGFRNYLKVAEEERLNLENPPERTPELFEKFLPYALALGVEQQWSEKFASVLETAGYDPDWYAGTGARAWSSGTFANSLSGSLSSAISSSSTAPGSSSGSGGGGSSGGGGGGGGGGGW
jgi:hypothetical protein